MNIDWRRRAATMTKAESDSLALRIALSQAGDDLLLSRDEVAAMLGLSASAVSNNATAGRLPQPIRIGHGPGRRGTPRWRLGDLRAYIAKSRGPVA
jgi:predicted DNA-binding transcriptional regulator AlpA